MDRASKYSWRKTLHFEWAIWLLLPGFAACLWAQSSKPKVKDDNPARGNCGYPNYCARTDRKTEPYSKNPPSPGHAGSIITDPTFGSRIVRVTDEKSNPNRAGISFQTPSSSEQNSWNRDSTKFYILSAASRMTLYEFNPATMSARLIGMPQLKWRGGAQFSYSDPDVLYGLAGSPPIFEKYEVDKDKASTVHDPADCLKLDRSVWGYDITVSADDRRFMAVFGPRQDASDIVYVYDRERGCRWYNTQTGEIGGQWGPKGKASINEPYFMHNARMSKSGKFIFITSTKQGSSGVWDVETTKVSPCFADAQLQCGGHRTLGYSHLVNPSLRVHPLDLLSRRLDRVGEHSPLVPDLSKSTSWYDQHLSWNNADPDDTAPVCFSTYHPTNPDTPGAPLQVDGPWENEIDCIQMDGKGSKIWRFAHTYSTARNGFWSTPRGNVSPDGRFFMFTSDWQDQLGNDPKGKGYRTDVFIVELR